MQMNQNSGYYTQQQPMMGNPYYGPNSYDPAGYAYNPMGYNSIPMPANQNALTPQEIQVVKSSRPAGSKIDLSIDQVDVYRAICTHKDNGRDIVQQINDGSGDVTCPLCGERWHGDLKSKEEIIELVNALVDQMQNAKWLGDLPTEVARDLFTMIPLLKKYPDIHEYAMNTFNKYYSARGMWNAQDANIYSMYNSLFSPNMGYAGINGYYGQPVQQPINTQQAMGMSAYQPNTVNPMVNPMQNPMQANPMQQNYGVNPAAPNQQFVQQANTMMGGTVYQPGMMNQPQVMPNGQPQVLPQQMMQQPMFGAVQGQPQVMPNGQPQVIPQQANGNTNDSPVAVAQDDGTVKSKTKIDL